MSDPQLRRQDMIDASITALALEMGASLVTFKKEDVPAGVLQTMEYCEAYGARAYWDATPESPDYWEEVLAWRFSLDAILDALCPWMLTAHGFTLVLESGSLMDGDIEGSDDSPTLGWEATWAGDYPGVAGKARHAVAASAAIFAAFRAINQMKAYLREDEEKAI